MTTHTVDSLMALAEALEQAGVNVELQCHSGQSTKEGFAQVFEQHAKAREDLRAAITEALRDSQRLDWVEATNQDNLIHIAGTWYTRNSRGEPHHRNNSLREGIDAVMG